MERKPTLKDYQIEKNLAKHEWIISGTRNWWRNLLSPTKWRAKPLASRSVYKAVDRISKITEGAINARLAQSLRQKEVVIVGHQDGRIILFPKSILSGKPRGILLNLDNEQARNLTSGREKYVEGGTYGDLDVDISVNPTTGRIRFVNARVGDKCFTYSFDGYETDSPTIYTVRALSRYDRFATTLIVANYPKGRQLVIKQSA